MKETNEGDELQERNEFDSYFRGMDDEFTLKLYGFPPGNNRRKEWIEDFHSIIPEDAELARNYGEGHFWITGKDVKGNFKSKHIYISAWAAKRYQPAPEVMGHTAQQLSSAGAPAQDRLTEKLLFKLIDNMGMSAPAARDPVFELKSQMEAMVSMFAKNMEMINTQIMGHTRKLVNERLEEKTDRGSGWMGELVQSIAPFLDNFLSARGIEDKLMRAKIEKSEHYQKISQDSESLNQFYDAVLETVGEEKADALMSKLGFSPETETEDAPAHETPVN